MILKPKEVVKIQRHAHFEIFLKVIDFCRLHFSAADKFRIDLDLDHYKKKTDLLTLAFAIFVLRLELDRFWVIFFQNLQNARKHKNNTKYQTITKLRY